MTEVVTTGAEVIATGAQYAQQTGASRSYLIYVGVAILAMIIGHQAYVYLQNKKAQERLEKIQELLKCISSLLTCSYIKRLCE